MFASMSQPAPRPATYQDVLDAPENLVAELLGGVLYTHPRPAFPHATAASVLGMDLGGPFQRGRGGPGGWWIFDEPELHFGPDVIVPGLAGWRRERTPRSTHGILPGTRARLGVRGALALHLAN
jgi:hypothetical protein